MVCREQRETVQCSGITEQFISGRIQWRPTAQCILVGRVFAKLQGWISPTFPGGCTTLGQGFSHLQPEFPAPQFLVVTLVIMSITTILAVNSLQAPISTHRANGNKKGIGVQTNRYFTMHCITPHQEKRAELPCGCWQSAQQKKCRMSLIIFKKKAFWKWGTVLYHYEFSLPFYWKPKIKNIMIS